MKKSIINKTYLLETQTCNDCLIKLKNRMGKIKGFKIKLNIRLQKGIPPSRIVVLSHFKAWYLFRKLESNQLVALLESELATVDVSFTRIHKIGYYS